MRTAADREWWNAIGEWLGLKLYGWDYRHVASFYDNESAKSYTGVTVEIPGWLAQRLYEKMEQGNV